jgi:hypothetical protein
MAKEKEKIGIETGDFITPGKAITISTISLVIWFVTGLSFKVLSGLFSNIPYQSYALVVSLSLSVLFSIYIVRKLVMNADMFMKIIIGILNTILIYTSANGAQATYSFLSPPETTSTGTSQKLSLIPFLDARPWIPDKFLMAENEALASGNQVLLSEKEELLRQNDILQSRINLLRNSARISPNGNHNDYLLLRDSIAMLTNDLVGCQKQNEELSRQLRNLQGRSNTTGTGGLQESLKRLERLNASCQNTNTQLARQLESIHGRIQQFNNRQGMWSQKTAGNRQRDTRYLPRDLAASIKQQVNKVMSDSTYYDFLFLTPINIKY